MDSFEMLKEIVHGLEDNKEESNNFYTDLHELIRKYYNKRNITDEELLAMYYKSDLYGDSNNTSVSLSRMNLFDVVNGIYYDRETNKLTSYPFRVISVGRCIDVYNYKTIGLLGLKALKFCDWDEASLLDMSFIFTNSDYDNIVAHGKLPNKHKLEILEGGMKDVKQSIIGIGCFYWLDKVLDSNSYWYTSPTGSFSYTDRKMELNVVPYVEIHLSKIGE